MYKEKYIKMAEGLTREGIKRFLDSLSVTDFFEAPASTRFHGNYKEGLAEHSINVATMLQSLTTKNKLHWDSDESPIIIGLFHDVCKTNTYGIQMRYTKDEKGAWIQKPFYFVDEALPLGHGEKSLFLLSRIIDLTEEEIMCIRWHMGAYEPKESYTALAKAKQQYPNILWTHLADELESCRGKILGLLQ